MRYKFIQGNRSIYGVEEMAKILDISRSGYYAWSKRKQSKRSIENEKIVMGMRIIHEKTHYTYGSPRMTVELNAIGIRCGKNRVARLMRKYGIMAKMRRRFKITTHSRDGMPVSENLLQNFSVTGPNKVWVSDISYIRTEEGWIYLAIILDLYSRKVVGWRMKERLTNDIVIEALKYAIRSRKPIERLIFHSDKGSQYTSKNFQELLKGYKFMSSMSGKGNCYDNAYAESFFHTLKTEWIYFKRYTTREEAKNSIFEYIEIFYNRFRRHSGLDYQTPEEFEEKSECQILKVA